MIPSWDALKNKIKGRLGIFLIGAAITLAVAILYAASPTWMEFQEYKIYDSLLGHAGAKPLSGQVVLVDIDEKSLARLGQWPWPRYRLALLLGLMRQAGAKAVGLDMLLAEPDRTSPRLLEKQFKDELNCDVSFAGLPDAFKDYDQALASMLKRGPNVISYYFDFSTDKSQEGERTPCDLPPARISLDSPPGAIPAMDAVIKAPGVICPLPILLGAAPMAGFFNMLPDSDNIIRRTPLVLGYEGGIRPSLALAVLMRGFNVSGAMLKTSQAGLDSLTLTGEALGTRTIPMDAKGRVFINYRGPGGTFPRISAADVLLGEADKAALAGKLVFLGSTAIGLRDIVATPLDRNAPGLEVQATIADMILRGDFILRPDWAPGLEVLVVAVMGLVSSALLSRTSGVWLFAPLVVLGSGMWFGSVWTMERFRFYLSPLYPLAVLSLNFLLLTAVKYWREEHQKRFIHTAFAHYLNPKVVAQIVASPEKLNLSGEEREVSVLFSDIRGFTSISEKLSPTQLVDLLHEYLTPMTRVITDSNGTLDKYIGDAIMAFWNAPLTVPNHRSAALGAAMGMLSALKTLNEGFQTRYGLQLHIGVGLNCGNVRVGNFGSVDLFSYTILGDNVNLGSRLEGLTKYYGQELLLSASAIPDGEPRWRFMEVDKVRVKGKNEPVTIYTAMTLEEGQRRDEELNMAAKALALYQTGEFKGALELYTALMPMGGRLYDLYAQRCQVLMTTPPLTWDGVFTHETK